MTSIYLVWSWDGWEDSSIHILCCFLDKEQALQYASEFLLAHNENITVELYYAGFAHKVEEVYTRCMYDHTHVLFNLVNWWEYGYDYKLSRRQVIAEAVEQYSPMCVDIDWDRLYTMYQELRTDEGD